MLEYVILFVLYSMVIWRIVHMLQSENGPGNIFGRLQNRIANMKGSTGSFKELYFCFNCMSIWFSIPFALWYAKNPIEFIIIVFGLSSSAILFNKFAE